MTSLSVVQMTKGPRAMSSCKEVGMKRVFILPYLIGTDWCND